MRQSINITDMVSRAVTQQPASSAREHGDAGDSFGSTLNQQMTDANAGSAATKPAQASPASARDPASIDGEAAPAAPGTAGTGAAGEDSTVAQDAPADPGEAGTGPDAAGPIVLAAPANTLPAVPLPAAPVVAARPVQDPAASVAPSGGDALDAGREPGAAAAPMPGVPAVAAGPAGDGGADLAQSAAREPVQGMVAADGKALTPSTAQPAPGVVPGAPGTGGDPLPAQVASAAVAAEAGAGNRPGLRGQAAAGRPSPLAGAGAAASGMQASGAAGPGQEPIARIGSPTQEGPGAPGTVQGGNGFAQSLAFAALPRPDPGDGPAVPRALPALDAAMGSPHWGNGLGTRISLGIAAGFTSATLAVNPPELGPVNIQLSMAGDEASLQFASQHAAVREAIEAAMPRLREVLAQDGIRLGEVAIDTGAGAGRDQARSDAAGRDWQDGDSPDPDQGDAPARSGPVRIDAALVDTFA